MQLDNEDLILMKGHTMSMPSALRKVGLLFCLQNHPIKITQAKAAPQPHLNHPVSSEVKYYDQ